MSYSQYDKESGLIIHFTDKLTNMEILFLIGFMFLSMVFTVCDEIFGPFDLPWILQGVKIVGTVMFAFLFIIIKLVWELFS